MNKVLLIEVQKGQLTYIVFFQNFLSSDSILTEGNLLEEYSHDYTEDLKYFLEIVLKPKNTEGVSRIVTYCNQNNISVTPSGARTGLSGGSHPLCGGVALSMERFNSIIEID